MVKSFLHYLREQLFDADELQGQYVELFKNPDGRDWAALPRGELGAWVTDRNVFVWDREKAMHNSVKRMIPPAEPGVAIPLYINRSGTTLYCSLASFTAHWDMPSGQRLVQHLQQHPFMKKYKIIDRAEMPAALRYQ